MEKRYLGDSVYVEIENGMIKLTTENGFGPTNTIYLELEVFDFLHAYLVDYITQQQQLLHRDSGASGEG